VPEQPPALGHYSSRDPQVVRQHLAWMDEYGIDFIASSWRGRDSWEDSTLRLYVVPEVQKTSSGFAILYESSALGFDAIREIRLEGEKAQRVIDDFAHLSLLYFDHPNYLRVDGRPVVFVAQSSAFTGQHDQVFDAIRSNLQMLGFDLLLVGSEVGWRAANDDHLAFLDAVSSVRMRTQPYEGYLMDAGFLADVSTKLAEWEFYAHPLGIPVIPTVEPGFNARTPDTEGNVAPRPIAPRAIAIGRESTSTLEEYIRVSRPFVDQHLRMIMISTWNGWGSDTQIEPSIVTSPTSQDLSESGFAYTGGYVYEGYGHAALEMVRTLLSDPATVDIGSANGTIPSLAVLSDNYPEPFNTRTIFQYTVPETMQVRVLVFDTLGRTLRILADGLEPPGFHRLEFDAGSLPSGVYFYRLETARHSMTKTMVLIR
jgi:hypothetical protein